MRVLLFGATGMIGQGVLLEALDDPDVAEVVAIVRRPTGIAHPKLKEIAHQDFGDFSGLADRLSGFDACFYCLGVSAVGMTEADYARVTLDYALAAARAVLAASPRAVFVYVSGMGTDATEKGRVMWARVKGRTENQLLAMPFRAAYMFRPGFIRPTRGVKSRTRLYRAIYAAASPLGGLLERVAPGSATSTSALGRAMLEVAKRAPSERIVDTRAINALAAAARGRP